MDLNTDIPGIDYDDPKEGFAMFGMAAYYAQCVEESIKLLIVVLAAKSKSPLPHNTYGDIFDALDKKTMGVLARMLEGYPTVAATLLPLALDLANKRNKLIHGFWERHGENILSSPGKRRAIHELWQLYQDFRQGDEQLKAAYAPLWAGLGIDDAFIAAEMERMKARSEAS